MGLWNLPNPWQHGRTEVVQQARHHPDKVDASEKEAASKQFVLLAHGDGRRRLDNFLTRSLPYFSLRNPLDQERGVQPRRDLVRRL